jgi:hypothetical protein
MSTEDDDEGEDDDRNALPYGMGVWGLVFVTLAAGLSPLSGFI